MIERIARRVTLLLARLHLGDAGERMERLGSEYGGWWLPLAAVKPDWIVHSAGVGEDVTFDEALLARVGCEVHAFDPTPRPLGHDRLDLLLLLRRLRRAGCRLVRIDGRSLTLARPKPRSDGSAGTLDAAGGAA